jgi:hypothetical protein
MVPHRMIADTRQFNLILIYSGMQFRFVSIVTNISSITIFSCSIMSVTVGSYFLNLIVGNAVYLVAL